MGPLGGRLAAGAEGGGPPPGPVYRRSGPGPTDGPRPRPWRLSRQRGRPTSPDHRGRRRLGSATRQFDPNDQPSASSAARRSHVSIAPLVMPDARAASTISGDPRCPTDRTFVRPSTSSNVWVSGPPWGPTPSTSNMNVHSKRLGGSIDRYSP